jgi:integrase
MIDADPSRKIRRPRKRRPEIYRPTLEELRRVRVAALAHERPAILLMEEVGLRRSEVAGCRWADLDLVQGRVMYAAKAATGTGFQSIRTWSRSFDRASVHWSPI